MTIEHTEHTGYAHVELNQPDRFGHLRAHRTLNDYADVCHAASVKGGWWSYSMRDEDPNMQRALQLLSDYQNEADEAGNPALAEEIDKLIFDLRGRVPVPGERKPRNVAELLFLIISEVVEAGEGARKDLMDDKLPHRKMEEVEIADTLIRIFDYAGGRGLDIQGALEEKMRFNQTREDHRIEVREAEGGKQW